MPLVGGWLFCERSEGLALAETGEGGEAKLVGGFGVFFLPGFEESWSETILDSGVWLGGEPSGGGFGFKIGPSGESRRAHVISTFSGDGEGVGQSFFGLGFGPFGRDLFEAVQEGVSIGDLAEIVGDFSRVIGGQLDDLFGAGGGVREFGFSHETKSGLVIAVGDVTKNIGEAPPLSILKGESVNCLDETGEVLR